MSNLKPGMLVKHRFTRARFLILKVYPHEHTMNDFVDVYCLSRKVNFKLQLADFLDPMLGNSENE